MPKFPGRRFSERIRALPILTGTRIPRTLFSRSTTTKMTRPLLPSRSPCIAGFPQKLAAGSQVISLSHTQIVKSNLSVTETFGFIRERAYSSIGQPFTPAQFASTCRVRLPGRPLASLHNQQPSAQTVFPGISIVLTRPSARSRSPTAYSMELGATAQFQGADTGFIRTDSILPPMPSGPWANTRLPSAAASPIRSSTPSTTETNSARSRRYDFTDFIGGLLVAELFLQCHVHARWKSESLLALQRVRRIYPGQVPVADPI